MRTAPQTQRSAELALRGNDPRKHRRHLPSRGLFRSRTAILAVAVVALFAASVLLGSYTVTVPDFFRILAAHLTGGEKIPRAPSWGR